MTALQTVAAPEGEPTRPAAPACSRGCLDIPTAHPPPAAGSQSLTAGRALATPLGRASLWRSGRRGLRGAGTRRRSHCGRWQGGGWSTAACSSSLPHARSDTEDTSAAKGVPAAPACAVQLEQTFVPRQVRASSSGSAAGLACKQERAPRAGARLTICRFPCTIWCHRVYKARDGRGFCFQT